MRVGRAGGALTARKMELHLRAGLGPLVRSGDAHQHRAVGLLDLDGLLGDDQDHLALHPLLDELQDVDAGGEPGQAHLALLVALAPPPPALLLEARDVELAGVAAQVQVEPEALNQRHAGRDADEP
ncbi:MAG: hypothetical protein QM765_28710 [Myxococcales bacterium]